MIDAISGRYGQEPLAHAIGELFVGEAFPPQAKRRALELVGHVKAALRERLLDARLDGGRDAQGGARQARPHGREDRLPGPLARLLGGRGRRARPFAENWLDANAFEFRRVLARLGKPVDRGDWWMSPHIVNAYYGSTLNEIVFPAGILQPPYFDPKADDAVNFGGIGMVIGHEITARLRRPRPPLRRRRQPARVVDAGRPASATASARRRSSRSTTPTPASTASR